MKEYVKLYFGTMAVYFLISLFSAGIILMMTSYPWLIMIPVIIVMFFRYVMLKKKELLSEKRIRINIILMILYMLSFSIFLLLGKGYPYASILTSTVPVLFFPFFPLFFILYLIGQMELYYTVIFVVLFLSLFLSVILYRRICRHRMTLIILSASVCLTVSGWSYYNRPQRKYAGHGFEYMHGYSSTDFTDYMVYSDHSKLAALDYEPSFTIKRENEMPILDGAEACYPLYASVARELYENIDDIERKIAADMYSEFAYRNGKIVSFTNSSHGYYRLIDGQADMFFGARPSRDQQEYAGENAVELNLTAIGREAFVFFVEEDNPVTSLTSEQLRSIYHGDIINWNEVGGYDQDILAFQRPEESGSQVMMNAFMGNVSLKEPMTYELVDSMAGILKEVSQYHNEAGALGYTFRYFLEGLQQEKGIRILEVDGIPPTNENIRSGSYPIITDLYCAVRANHTNPNIDRVLEFLLSDDGQYLVEHSGYAPIK